MTLTATGLAIGGATLAGGTVLFALAVHLARHRERRGAFWLAASLLAQAIWCLVYGVEFLTPDTTWFVAMELVSLLGITWLGYLFLGFALEYTGYRGLHRTRFYLALALVPAAGSALLATAPYHSLVWRDVHLTHVFGVVVLGYTLGFWGKLVVFASLAYATVGVLLLLDTILDYGSLYHREAVAVGFSVVPPVAGVLAWMAGLGPGAALNWGVVLSLPHALLDVYAFADDDLFGVSPVTRRVAEAQALDAVPDPVVIVDEDARLVAFNEAAARIPRVRTDAVGTLVSAVLPVDADDLEDGGERSVHVSTEGHHREFAVRPSPLRDSRDRVVGHALLLRNVTREREKQQRLAVYNRVLRHNLRNELTKILGSAETIEERAADDDVTELAAGVRRAGERLDALGETTRRYDRLTEADSEIRAVDFHALVERAVGSATAETAASVDLDVATDLEVRTDASYVRLALENVVENAVVHDDSSDPSVRVTVEAAEREEYVAVVAVRDRGPGIPPAELSVLRRGTEDELSHGSGVGLWVVTWCLRRVGGEVTFERRDDGTTVRLWIPGLDGPTDGG